MKGLHHRRIRFNTEALYKSYQHRMKTLIHIRLLANVLAIVCAVLSGCRKAIIFEPEHLSSLIAGLVFALVKSV